jgi:hypothetical protein
MLGIRWVICPKPDDSGLRRTDPCGVQIRAGIDGIIPCCPVDNFLSHLLSRICISISFIMAQDGRYKINNVAFSNQYVGEDHRTVRMYH